MRLVAIAACLSISLPAAANPITAGVGLGLTAQTSDTTGAPPTADKTYALFGRVGFTSRLAAQVELQRVTGIRSGTALLVVELGASGHLVPILVAGAGVDRAEGQFGPTEGHHFEGGLGLEYRGDGGITIGADARMGGRSIDQGPPTPVFGCGDFGCNGGMSYQAGEYRSGRLYVGVRF